MLAIAHSASPWPYPPAPRTFLVRQNETWTLAFADEARTKPAITDTSPSQPPPEWFGELAVSREAFDRRVSRM